jgi:translation initiation factor 1A
VDNGGNCIAGKPKKFQPPSVEEQISRIRMPKNDEVLGVIEQRMGYGKMTVACLDGNTRLCRVRTKRRGKTWLIEGDVVLVKPWELQSDIRGDIIFKYTKAQADWLRRKGIIEQG